MPSCQSPSCYQHFETYSCNRVIKLVGERSQFLLLLLGLGVDNRSKVESEIPGLAPEVVLNIRPRLLLDQPLDRNDLFCRLLSTSQCLSRFQRLEEESLLEGSVSVSGLVSVVSSSWQRTRTEEGVNDVASHTDSVPAVPCPRLEVFSDVTLETFARSYKAARAASTSAFASNGWNGFNIVSPHKP